MSEIKSQAVARPLRRKVLLNTISTILFSFIIFGLLASYSLNKLASEFSRLNQKRAETEKANLEKVSEENIKKISRIYGAALEVKGRNLIAKDSASILPMVEDNAFGQLRSFLAKALKDDDELALAAFYVVEGPEIKAWQYATRQYPEGLELPIEYSKQDKSWVARVSHRRGQVRVPDPEIAALIGITDPRISRKTLMMPDSHGKQEIMEVYDGIIPVYKKKASSQEIARALKRGEPVGYLRYVLSLEKMEKSIQDEKKALEASLSKLEKENDEASAASRRIVKSTLNQSFVLLGLIAVAVFLFTYIVSWFFSRRLTEPVNQLTIIAEMMARGRYDQKVAIESDDEIGVLASTFHEMAQAIIKRDEEIRSAERQLSEIFESVPEGIISINAGGVIGPKYSKYTEWLINTHEIAGRSVRDLVFAPGIDELREEARKSVEELPNLIGKPEIHYEVTKLFLPNRIHFPLPAGHSDTERYIDLTYQPVIQNGVLAKLLLVLQNATAAVLAEKAETAARLHEDRNIVRILQMKNSKQESLPVFMDEIESFFERLRIALADGQEAESLLLLHGIKGNARTIGFEHLTELIHNLEMKNRINQDAGAPPDRESLRHGLTPIFSEWHEIQGLYKALYPRYGSQNNNGEEASSRSENDAIALIKKLDDFMEQSIQEKRQMPLRSPERIIFMLKSLYSVPLSRLGGSIQQKVDRAAKALKKEVDLVLEIGSGFVDLQCEKALGECLTHLVNNAVSHGLSPEGGRLKISLKETAGMAIVEVQDDGPGVDIEKVKKEALRKGLITAEESATMKKEDAVKLIFKEGLSTMKQANQVSGAGVGLSAVSATAKSFGGHIEVHDGLPAGTLFRVSLRSIAQLPVMKTRVPMQELTRMIADDIRDLMDLEDLRNIRLNTELAELPEGFVLADVVHLPLALGTLIGDLAQRSSTVDVSFASKQGIGFQCNFQAKEKLAARNIRNAGCNFAMAHGLSLSYLKSHGCDVTENSHGLSVTMAFS